MINKENIESFIVDYIDGTLSPEQRMEVERFVEIHPEFKEFLSELPILEVPKANFSGKESLKMGLSNKPRSFSHVKGDMEEIWMVAGIENELNTEERLLFDRSKNENPLLQKEMVRFEKTILLPNTNEVFTNKSSLHKKTLVLQFVKWGSVGVAASIALFLTWNQLSSTTNGIQTAKKVVNSNPKKVNTATDSVMVVPAEQKMVWDHTTENSSRLPNDVFYEANNPLEEQIILQQIEDHFQVLNDVAIVPLIVPSENMPLIEDALENASSMEIKSHEKEVLTAKDYVFGQFNKKLFGKEKPSREERVLSIGDKLAAASGGRVEFGVNSLNNKKLFRFRIGKISIERKKSIGAVTK
jgi:hypothetical protein